jgi:hypothetical protein
MGTDLIEGRPERPADLRAVVYLYTQTGQLREVAEALTTPLAENGWQVRWVAVQPRVRFPFPWPLRRFFGVFSQTVDAQSAVDLIEPPGYFGSTPDELVIIAYQVWYLSPSLPIRSLLKKHPEAVHDRAVISLVACRNMWYSAAVEVSALLKEAGARSAEVVAATDTHRSFTTLVTTLRWLLTGRREPFLWFSRAGVDDVELARIAAVGRSLAQWKSMPPDAAPIVPALAAADLLAGWAFRKWGATVRRAARFSRVAYGIAIGSFVGTLAVGILIGLPLIVAAASIGGTRFAAAVQNYLAPRMTFGEPVGRKGVTA